MSISESYQQERPVLQASSADPVQDKAELFQQPLPAGVLKLLLDRLGISIQAGAMAQACQKSQQGLAEIAPVQRINFIFHALRIKNVQAAQLRWRRFDQRRLPAMLFIDCRWQLIERTGDGVLMLTDENGACHATPEEELEDSTVLWLRTEKQPERQSFFSLRHNVAARLLLGEMFKSKRWLSDVVIATVMVNLLAVSTSLFALQVYDRVVPTLAYATLWTLVAGMGIIVSLDWCLKILRARILDSVACMVDKAVSQQVFDHVLRLQLNTRPRSLGTLAAQVGGLDSVRQFFSSGVVFALVDMPFALMFICFISLIGGPVALVYLGLLPVAAILGLYTQKRIRHLMKQQMIRSHERQGLLVDSIQGAESIRANNAGWRFSEQWQEITASISRYNIQQKAISNRATVTTGSLATAAYVSALVVGVGQIQAGNMTMGALIACSILGGRVIAPVAQSVQYLSQWQNVVQSLQMVNQVMTMECERRPEQSLLMPDEPPDKIELEGVRFAYPESPIQQLNIAKLSIKAGERVAVLGPIGSGKSTLLKVLAGLYRPSEGRVRFGNADLWEVDPNIVADQIGYLPQSVHLFKGTLRSNLILSGAVRDTHLLQVAREIGIDRIAAGSPLSMDLPISEGGEGLSGGQRQLVGLGRVLLARPKIWLLDEPTASLDNESEKQVLQAIRNNVKHDDILLISTHRPMLASQLANRVIVLQHGEIAADGKPERVLPQMMQKYTRRPGTLLKMPQPSPGVYNGGFNHKGPANVI